MIINLTGKNVLKKNVMEEKIMTEQRKKNITIFCKSLYSVFIGAGMVAVLSLTASFYNELHTDIGVDTQTAQYIEFPENQEMLNNMSEKLAREGSYLSEIAPAAGDVDEDKEEDKINQ